LPSLSPLALLNGHKYYDTSDIREYARLRVAARAVSVEQLPRGFGLSQAGEDAASAGDDAVDIFGRGLPAGDADAHGSPAAPGGIGKESLTISQDGSSDAVGEGVVVGLGGVYGRR
jgi:hypothetical protein